MGKKATKIIMFGRGFVIISNDYDEDPITEWGVRCIPVHSGATIRNWGTVGYGIGLLCSNGPQKDTTLDGFAEKISIPVTAVHQILSLSDAAEKSFEKEIQSAIKKCIGA